MKKIRENIHNYEKLRTLFQENSISVVSIVEHFLEEADKQKKHNAFIEVFTEEILNKAKIADQNFRLKKEKPLEGMLVAIKDNILYKSHHCTASSKILKGFIAPYSATIVNKLIANGAIIVGRTNCDEFAMGSTGQFSSYGTTLNPHNKAYVSGGSSSGSAAAVALNLCHIAIGSDTGGSVRLPASWCGIYGLKPTYGRISRFGLIAYANSLDHLGIMSNDLGNIEKTLSIVSGADGRDLSIPSCGTEAYLPLDDKQRDKPSFIRIKELEEIIPLQSDVYNNYIGIVKSISEKGYSIKEKSIPSIKEQVKAFQMIACAEACSNMGRFDGIRYGQSLEEQSSAKDLITKNRTTFLGNEVKRKIVFGSYALHKAQRNNYYQKAQVFRKSLSNEIHSILKGNSFIISPTCPLTACKKEEQLSFQDQYRMDIFTVLANLTGLPAINIPTGKGDNNLPLGIQLIAPLFNEAGLFNVSKLIAQLVYAQL
ncbi:MAG: Asp-tRNA(Asn)/Glu-tRNA(Gln) amidotransferase subunit GatA [Bacteroidales bacterium]